VPKITNSQLKNHISELESQNKALQVEIDSNKNIAADKEKASAEVHKVEVNQLNAKITELETEVKNKQDQLNKRELKKLAEAFNDQEQSYKSDSRRWFWYVVIAFILLALSLAYSAHESVSKSWQDKIGYYLINFVVITFLVFSLRHFSYFVRLANDYANRKTLAQSYNNILSTAEDAAIKLKFIEKTTDILCAPSDIKQESYTVPEKLLDTLSEISKNLSKKI